MNPLTALTRKKRERLLSVFFTAGYPGLDSTKRILLSLQENQVDFVEIGMPYSDPLADGPVIQQTNTIAIANGMSIPVLFSQLHELKDDLKIPFLLMGYLNPVLQYGVERFCRDARHAGASGIILPDLPLYEYKAYYQRVFSENGLHFIPLITPTTKAARIREIDALGTAFIYAVSASATTGRSDSERAEAARNEKITYLAGIRDMGLKTPVVVGFGINNQETLSDAWQWSSGAIIGSAYLQELSKAEDESEAIKRLLDKIGIPPTK